MHQEESPTAKLNFVVSTYPMDIVCINYLFLEIFLVKKSTEVITDRFTIYTQVIQTKKQSAKTTARFVLTILAVAVASPTVFILTTVETSKSNLLISCVPLLTLISQGLLLITLWSMECQKDPIACSLQENFEDDQKVCASFMHASWKHCLLAPLLDVWATCSSWVINSWSARRLGHKEAIPDQAVSYPGLSEIGVQTVRCDYVIHAWTFANVPFNWNIKSTLMVPHSAF